MKILLSLCIVLILSCCFLLGCGNTTNSLIYTGYSNILTYVYITEHGTKYHDRDCYQIKGLNATSIKRTEAVERGYTICYSCFY